MSTVITPFQGTDSFSTATFNNRISQINTGFSYISNPNLLDNWYFGNPVNQRGQTSYTGENIYSVDRWKIYNATYNVDTGELISNGSFGQINQITDKYEDMAGKTVTLSILFDSLDDGWSVRLHNDDKFIAIPTGDKLFTHTYVYPYDGATRSLSLCLISHVSGSKCKPIAVKLELGTTQTLAHQENGVWVLNEIPDFGEQLARCQRYQINLVHPDEPNYGVIGTGYAPPNSDFAAIFIPTPITLRAKPSIEKSGVFKLMQGYTLFDVTSMDTDRITNNGVVIFAHISGNTLSGEYMLYHWSDAMNTFLLNSNL